MQQMKVIDVLLPQRRHSVAAVANQVDAAIIRCGYRGYGAAGRWQ